MMFKKFIMLCILLGLIAFIAIESNPKIDDFDVWYQSHVEVELRDTVNKKIEEEKQVGNGFVQLLVDGVWKAFAQDQVENEVDEFMKNIRDHVIVEKNLFFTDYTINLPDGNILYVRGAFGRFFTIEK